MGQCFVIQPFDRGRYDKRYKDVSAPAIRDAALEPYRVDHDPSVSIPIEEIQVGIQSCEACQAEIASAVPPGSACLPSDRRLPHPQACTPRRVRG
jgi:hypothetical protein